LGFPHAPFQIIKIRKEQGMRKYDHQFLLRFNEAEKNKISCDCQNLGYRNRSQYLRDLIQGNYPYTNLYREVVKELRKQGNNLNQTARYCHQENKVDEEVLRVLTTIVKSHAELLQIVRGIK
jgi:hypothetical protein